MDQMDAIIHQRLYWAVIIESIRKECSNSDTCQWTKQSNKKLIKYQIK